MHKILQLAAGLVLIVAETVARGRTGGERKRERDQCDIFKRMGVVKSRPLST